MSDNSEVFIRLDARDAIEREAVVRSVTNWLVTAKVITHVGLSEKRIGRGPFMPGSRWRDAVDEVPGGNGLWIGDEVNISVDIDNVSALSNWEPWTCARCAAEFMGESLLEGWITDYVEPTATCPSCGWTALLGDWPCEYPGLLVGGPIIEFRNWHPLRAEFSRELTQRLGGHRVRHFCSHL